MVKQGETHAAESSASGSVKEAVRKNTAVYVTGLPEDVTMDELYEAFSKCGILMEDLVTGKPLSDVVSGADHDNGVLFFILRSAQDQNIRK